MGMSKLIFIVMSTTLFSAADARMSNDNLINTKAIDNMHSGVVFPGTRLAAGAPGQNEFYILSSKGALKSNDDIAKIKNAISETLRKRVTSKNDMPIIKVAAKITKHKMVRNKTHTKVKLSNARIDG